MKARKRLRKVVSSESPERAVEQLPSSQPAVASHATLQPSTEDAVAAANSMREVQVQNVASEIRGISDRLGNAAAKHGRSNSRSPPRRRQATPPMQKRSARGSASSVQPLGQVSRGAGPWEPLRPLWQAAPAQRIFRPSLRKAPERGSAPSTAWTPTSSAGALWISKAKGDPVCHHNHRVKSEAAGCQWICADCGEVLFFDGWRFERVIPDERALRQQELHGPVRQAEIMQANGDISRPGWF